MSDRLDIEEATDARALSTDREDPPGTILSCRPNDPELRRALAHHEIDIPVLALVGRQEASREAEGVAFAEIPEAELAGSFHDDAASARLSQVIRRAAWCNQLERSASVAGRAHARAALTGRLRALQVDDSPAALAFAKHVLHQSGIDLVQRVMGQEGLAAAAQSEFDAALVDSQLPDASGADLVRRLLARAPGVAAIGLTSNSAPDAERSFFAAGAWAYMDKGEATAMALAPTIRQCVRMARLWRDAAASGQGAIMRPDLAELPPTG